MQTNTKDRVRELLDEEPRRSFVSRRAYRTRSWASRAIASGRPSSALRADGFEIESVTKRGHRLVVITRAPSTPRASRASSTIPQIISRVPRLPCASTNTVAKQRAEEGAPQGTLVVANSQSAGRGRQGRSFSSPTGHGRVLHARPAAALRSSSDVALVTSFAACCLAAAIDEMHGASMRKSSG